MKLTAVADEERGAGGSEIESLTLTSRQVAYLEKLCAAADPVMAPAFGRPHFIRTLLDCIEQSGIDLTEAATEQDITRLALRSLTRPGGNSQRESAIAPISVALANRPSGRRSYRSNLPERGRHRSGNSPRSNRG